MSLLLRNPHSVLAVLETRPDDVIEVQLSPGPTSPAWEEVARLAAAQRIIVRPAAGRRSGRGRRPTEKTTRTSAAHAVVKERRGLLTEQLFRNAAEQKKGEPYGLWLALDCLQDPHNVGAIFRTAAFFGVQGIVVTKSRSAPLNATVYDVASGGLEYVPFSNEGNLARTLKTAKKAGLWVLGTSEHADGDIAEIERDRPWLLVLGNEEKGLRRLTLESCDVVCRIVPKGAVQSLNVSVAAGILISALTGRDNH